MDTRESVFVHINNVNEPIAEGDKVSFEVEMGPKGASAINVNIAKEPVKKPKPAPGTEKKPEAKEGTENTETTETTEEIKDDTVAEATTVEATTVEENSDKE